MEILFIVFLIVFLFIDLYVYVHLTKEISELKTFTEEFKEKHNKLAEFVFCHVMDKDMHLEE